MFEINSNQKKIDLKQKIHMKILLLYSKQFKNKNKKYNKQHFVFIHSTLTQIALNWFRKQKSKFNVIVTIKGIKTNKL